MKIKKFILILLIIILPFLGGGCELLVPSTESGNPNFTNHSMVLAQTICGKLGVISQFSLPGPNFGDQPTSPQAGTGGSGCFETLNYEDCLHALMGVTSIDSEVGVPEGEFQNFREMMLEEQAGHIIANQEEGHLCISEIESLDCESQAVQEAYDEFDTDFNDVENIFSKSTACEFVFVDNF